MQCMHVSSRRLPRRQPPPAAASGRRSLEPLPAFAPTGWDVASEWRAYRESCWCWLGNGAADQTAWATNLRNVRQIYNLFRMWLTMSGIVPRF